MKNTFYVVLSFVFLTWSAVMFASTIEKREAFFVVSLPEGFTLKKTSPLHDFDVYKIEKDGLQYAGIYVGNQPGFPILKDIVGAKHILSKEGKAKTSSVWKGDVLVAKEILTKLEEQEWPMYVHAWTTLALPPEKALLANKILSSMVVMKNPEAFISQTDESETSVNLSECPTAVQDDHVAPQNSSLVKKPKSRSTKNVPKTIRNSIDMEFILVQPGIFIMGGGAAIGVQQPHSITISRPFYLGKYEVTQEQWMAIMDGNNPSHFKKGGKYPIEQVSYEDVTEFIRRLNKKEDTDKYRLPTEAEWEYTARAGTTMLYSFGDDVLELNKYAWYNQGDFVRTETHPVGEKKPNPWGFYDMHGHVAEWVNDWYEKNYFVYSISADPQGPSEGVDRVIRGGGWDRTALFSESAHRVSALPQYRYFSIGFRLARAL
jgi:formylglycine-generating enzyme required for sulfatase activity